MPSFAAVSPRGAPHVATLEVLRGLGIQKPVMMLTPDGYYGYYLNYGYQHRLTEDIHAQTFEQFMAADGINMIVVTPSLRQDPRYTSSGRFRQLLASPAALGFTAFPVPFTDHTVLVRQNLLSE